MEAAAQLGMTKQIRPFGIFPEIDDPSVGPALEALLGTVDGWGSQQKLSKCNTSDGIYHPYMLHIEKSDQNLRKEWEQGHFTWYSTLEEAEKVHRVIILPRVGAVVEEGSVKCRLTHHLRRSPVNTTLGFSGRLVPPRPSDAIEDVCDYLASCSEAEGVTMVFLDSKDAFAQIRVHEDGRRFARGVACSCTPLSFSLLARAHSCGNASTHSWRHEGPRREEERPFCR